MEDELLAFDTSGVPVMPPIEGFQNLGQVEGTAQSNAYLAEQEAERRRLLTQKQRLAEQEALAKAEQQAMRMAGQMEYQQLISGGAKPEEALRRVAHKLYFNSPSGLASALRATRPPAEAFQPVMTPVEGGRILQSGPGRSQFIANKPRVMPPDARAKQKILEGQMNAMRGDFGSDPAALAKLEAEYLHNSTNWMGGAQGPTMPAQPAIAAPAASTNAATVAASPYKEGEIIRSKKDPKKRYKIVNGEPVEI